MIITESVVDPGGPRGPCPHSHPQPCKNKSLKKMAAEGGRIHFMFLDAPPSPYPAAGSATANTQKVALEIVWKFVFTQSNDIKAECTYGCLMTYFESI